MLNSANCATNLIIFASHFEGHNHNHPGPKSLKVSPLYGLLAPRWGILRSWRQYFATMMRMRGGWDDEIMDGISMSGESVTGAYFCVPHFGGIWLISHTFLEGLLTPACCVLRYIKKWLLQRPGRPRLRPQKVRRATIGTAWWMKTEWPLHSDKGSS